MLAFKLSKNSCKHPSFSTSRSFRLRVQKYYIFPYLQQLFSLFFNAFRFALNVSKIDSSAHGGSDGKRTHQGENGGRNGFREAERKAIRRSRDGSGTRRERPRQGRDGKTAGGNGNRTDRHGKHPHTFHMALLIYMLWPHGNHGTIRRQTHGMGAAHDDAGIRQPTIPARKHYPSEDSRRT